MKASAPGKIVLWGEYAVLDGAPAAVLAVDRYAEVSLMTRAQGWQFRSRGFQTPGVDTPLPHFCQAPAAQVVEAILQAHGFAEYPQPFQITSDTADFYDPTAKAKLGIGSSAAVCTATYRLLAELLKWTPSLQEAVQIHRAFQGGKGSGLDVAASWLGGTLRFSSVQSQVTATPFTWPSDLHWSVIWTGTSSSTPQHLQSFSEWIAKNDIEPLDALAALSADLFDDLTLEKLAAYQAQLQRLDDAAGVGNPLVPYTSGHQRCSTSVTVSANTPFGGSKLGT
ncbi:MAG: hypothetical protein AAF993_16790, partial [Pseudomonadota bacterium]